MPAEIPSLIVRIPDNYPSVPPEYVMNGYQNSSFLLSIEKYVGKQLTSMNLYSVTQLLHVWVSGDVWHLVVYVNAVIVYLIGVQCT